MKIRPVGAELFQEDRRTDGRAGRQTDMTKPTVAFRNIASAPQNSKKKIGIIIFLTSAPIQVSCGVKAQLNQGSERILLGR